MGRVIVIYLMMNYLTTNEHARSLLRICSTDGDRVTDGLLVIRVAGEQAD